MQKTGIKRKITNKNRIKMNKMRNKIDFLESVHRGSCALCEQQLPCCELIPVNPPDLALETLAVPAVILINTVQKGVDKITC
jgi:hypothetical protein